MIFGQRLYLAWRSLLARRWRVVAAIALMAAGVAAIVFCASVVSGFNREIDHLSFGPYGRAIVVRPVPVPMAGVRGLQIADMTRLAGLPGAEGAAAWVQGIAPLHGRRGTEFVPVFGAAGQILNELDADLVRGRQLDTRDDGGRADCLLGGDLARLAAVGSDIRLGNSRCRIVGILGPPRSAPGRRFSGAVITTVGAARRNFIVQLDDRSPREVDWISVFARPGESLVALTGRIDQSLRRSRGLDARRRSAFSFEDPLASARQQAEQRRLTTRLLYVVTAAAVLTSLAGFSMVSFLLFDVRRREVALLLSMGATPRDVMFQFAMEGALMAVVAVGIGAVWGWTIVQAVAFRWRWPAEISGMTLLLAASLGLAAFLFVTVVAAIRVAGTPPAIAAKT